MDYISNVYTIFNAIYQIFDFLNVIFSTIAAFIFVYLFYSKRDYILSIYKFLVNYTFQISLNELYKKIDELNQYDADEITHRQKVIEIINEIIGQMRGNPIMVKKCKPILKRLSKYEEQPDLLTNPRKRSLMAELKETLRNINIQSYRELTGDKNE